MKENTVYLLYNTNASNVKLQQGLEAGLNREWEYEDKEEFTIMYSPDDERKYTDIKILSKTKLKQRPKSADQLMHKHKVSVEGILIRRSNSLSMIEEDLLVLRRCPQIKPLLSETEIRQLQLLLEECRRKNQAVDKRESKMSNGLHQLFADHQNLRNIAGDIKRNLHDVTKGNLGWRTPDASPERLDANKAREKAKILAQITKSDNAGKTKPLDKWEKTPINSKAFKDGESKNRLTGVTQEVKPKTQNFVGTRSKSQEESKNNQTKSKQYEGKPKKPDFVGTRSKLENNPKNDNRKSKQNKTVNSDEGTKTHRNKNSKSQPQAEKKGSKKKSKTSLENEHKEKKPKKLQDSVKTKNEMDKLTRSKESLSDQDQFSHSSGKTPTSKQKEPRKKSDDDKTKSKKNKEERTPITEKTGKPDKSGKSKPRSKDSLSDQDQLSHSSGKTPASKQKEPKKKSDDDKTKVKKNKGEKTPTIEKTEKPNKSGKSNPVVESNTLPKGEKRSNSSINLSSKQKLKKGKTDKVKTKTSHEADLDEDLLTNKDDGKSIQTKSSPPDKSKTTNKTRGSKTENSSGKKGKTKDKLLPGTLPYIIHYILSNPHFINLGWTLQPTEKALSRIVTFKTMPANPQSYCFRNRDNVEKKFYPSGVLALNIAEDGTGRINYPSGTPAVIITRSPAGMKLTLYSYPTNDLLVKESFHTRIIGMFDSFGNGVVNDSNGKKILNFNQMQGVYYNPSRPTPYKWKWSCFKVLEAQRIKELLNAMINEVKQPAPTPKGGKAARAASSSRNSKKSVTSLEKKPVDKLYEALLEELPYPVMPKPKMKIKTHDNAFKSIILKINKEMTLRINGQDSVAVHFSAQTLFYKMDLGVRVNPESVERLDEVRDNGVESVPTVLGDLLHPSPSLRKLHQLLDPNRIH